MGYAKLKSLDTGSIVRIQEGSAYKDFYVAKIGYPNSNYNNVLLLRRYAYDDEVAWDNDSLKHSDHSYDVGSLDEWMQNYVSKFPTNVQKYIQNVPIEILDGGVNDGSTKKTIYRKAFALSATEVGYGPASGTNPLEGEKIPMLDGAEKRVCYLENGKAISWLLRSRNAKTAYNPQHYCWRVKNDGDYGNECWQYAYHYPRPAFCLPGDITIQTYSDANTTPLVIANMPPEAPTGLSAPASSLSSTNFTLSWQASTDTDEGDSILYRIERSLDGGLTWTSIASGIGSTSYITNVAYNLCDLAIYRVYAYNSTYLNYSEPSSTASVAIINNVSPTAPKSIAATGGRQGDTIRVVWGVSTDDDGNLKGYCLERNVNGTGWVTVYDGNALVRTYQDNDTANIKTVQYRVYAYDSYGAQSSYRTMSTALTLLEAISLSLTHKDGDVLTSGGIYNESVESYVSSDDYSAETSNGEKTLNYTFTTNADDSPAVENYECELSIDGTVVSQSPNSFTFDSSTGTTNIEWVLSADEWMKLLDGEHTLIFKITDADGNYTSDSFSFTKKVSGAVIQTDTIEMSNDISYAALTVTGNFNQNNVHVLVTNNAADDNPVWQEIAWSNLNNGTFFNITNTEGDCTKFAVKLVCVGSEDETSWISGINGTVGKNYFAMLEARLSALENS